MGDVATLADSSPKIYSAIHAYGWSQDLTSEISIFIRVYAAKLSKSQWEAV
jgi:hypothetical protein